MSGKYTGDAAAASVGGKGASSKVHDAVPNSSAKIILKKTILKNHQYKPRASTTCGIVGKLSTISPSPITHYPFKTREMAAYYNALQFAMAFLCKRYMDVSVQWIGNITTFLCRVRPEFCCSGTALVTRPDCPFNNTIKLPLGKKKIK